MPNVSTDPRKEYDIEHIPGARFFDIDSPSLSDATNPLPHMLPPADLFASSVQELGVREGKPLVIYARKGFVAAARAWWMFRVFGKDDVFVLDGGLTSWKEAGYETASRVEAMSATEIPGKPLTPVFRKDFVKDMDEILQQIRDKQGVIIDARAADRFFSRVPEPRKELRSGHMPGALSVPATTLVDANGRLKSLDDINDILEKAGFQHAGQGPVSLSCGSGVTAAIVCLALHQVGVTNAAVYDGSWTEYGAHDNPVVSG